MASGTSLSLSLFLPFFPSPPPPPPPPHPCPFALLPKHPTSLIPYLCMSCPSLMASRSSLPPLFNVAPPPSLMWVPRKRFWWVSRKRRNKEQHSLVGNRAPLLEPWIFRRIGPRTCFRLKDRVCLKERWLAHLVFNKTCVDENLFPKVVGRTAYRFATDGRSILSSRIRNCHRQIGLLERDIARLKRNSRMLVSQDQWIVFCSWLGECAVESIKDLQLHHQKKLDAIRISFGLNPQTLPDRWVVNLSSECLSVEELGILKLGLKFVPSPFVLPQG